MELNQQRYFAVSNDQHSGYIGILMPDNDIAPLDTLTNAVQVYPTAAGTVPGYEDIKIILVILQPRQQRDMQEIAETEEWDSMETVIELDIMGSYAGTEYSDRKEYGLFYFYPELQGQKQIGTDEETGEPIMVDIVSRTRWP